MAVVPYLTMVLANQQSPVHQFSNSSDFKNYFGAGVFGVAGGAGVAGVDPAGAGVEPVGAGFAGALTGLGGADPLMTEPGPRWPMIASARATIMNNAARTAVAFDNTVAPARAPNADWLLPPPNAAAMSPLPCCSRITSSSSVQMST